MEDAFDAYARRVLVMADEAEVEQCRSAFIAGVCYLLNQLEGYVLQAPLRSGRDYLAALRIDCDEFLREICARLRAAPSPPADHSSGERPC